MSSGMLNISAESRSNAAEGTKDIYSILKQEDDFFVWSNLVDRVGLADLLQGSSFMTLFALTDDALSVGPNLSIPAEGVQMAPELRDRIKLLLQAHIVAGVHGLEELSASSRSSTNLAGGLVLTSNNKYNITISWESSVSSAEGTLSSAPFKARNGLVYAIGPLVAQPLKQ